MLADISGNGGAGTVEVVAAGQLVSQEREVERSAMGQEVLKKIMGGFRPGSFVIAAGGSQLETGTILQPLVTQFVEPSWADHQSLRGGESVERASVEGGKDFLDIEGRSAVS